MPEASGAAASGEAVRQFEQLQSDMDAMLEEHRRHVQTSMHQMQADLLREQRSLFEERQQHLRTRSRECRKSHEGRTSRGQRPTYCSNGCTNGGSGAEAALQADCVVGRDSSASRPQLKRSNGFSFSIIRKKSQGPFHELVQYIVSTNLFDYTCAALILCNSAFIGAHVEWTASNPGKADPLAFSILRYCFLAMFSVELFIRISAYRCSFFCGPDVSWNVFDFCLVGMSWLELLVDVLLQSYGHDSIQRIIQIVRMVRVVRIIRVFRFFRELRIMISMIVDSMKNLLWLVVLLCLMLYAFSICFTLGAVDALQNDRLAAKDRDIMAEAYGNVMRSTLSLFKCMSGGISWGEMLHPWVQNDSIFFIALFLLYISFTIFAVLNIVTGVFVDGALQNTQNERDIVIQEEMRHKEKLIRDLTHVFSEIDKDESGTITLEEFEDHLKDPKMSAYFNALKLDPSDTRLLFSLMENEDTGEVEIDDFVAGCLRMKGEAKSIDVQTLMFKSKQMHRLLGGLTDLVEDQFLGLEQRLVHLAHCLCRTPPGGAPGSFGGSDRASLPPPSPTGKVDWGEMCESFPREGAECVAYAAGEPPPTEPTQPDGGERSLTRGQTLDEESELQEDEAVVGQGGLAPSLAFMSPLGSRPRLPHGAAAGHRRRAGPRHPDATPQAQPAGDPHESGRHHGREGSKVRSREGTSRESSRDRWLSVAPAGWFAAPLSREHTTRDEARGGLSEGAVSARAAALVNTGGLAALAAFEGDTDTPASRESTASAFYKYTGF